MTDSVALSRASLWTVVLVVLAGGGVGCTTRSADPAEAVPPQVTRLTQIYQMAQMRTKGNQSRPKTLNDFKQSEPSYPQGFKALQNGDCVFVWSAYAEAPANPAATVLAYEKGAPEQGGYVVMADGTIKQLTAAEFQAAPKAK